MGPPFRQPPFSPFAVHPLLFSRVSNQPLPTIYHLILSKPQLPSLPRLPLKTTSSAEAFEGLVPVHVLPRAPHTGLQWKLPQAQSGRRSHSSQPRLNPSESDAPRFSARLPHSQGPP